MEPRQMKASANKSKNKLATPPMVLDGKDIDQMQVGTKNGTEQL